MAAYYVAAVGSLALMPYLSVLLSAGGLTDVQITLALSVFPLGTLFLGPAWATLADRTGAPHRVLQAATAVAAAATLAVALAPSAGLMVAAMAALALGRSPLVPLADAMSLRLLAGRPGGYGRLRAWGSGAFLVVVFLSGALASVTTRAPAWLAGGLLLAGTGVALTLPPSQPGVRRPGASTALLTHPVLGPALVVMGLHGITVTTYDRLFTLHAARMGLSGLHMGSALALGVAVEIVVMVFGRALLARLGVGGMLVLGIGAGIPRWYLTGTLTDPTALVAIQGLHGLSFGAWWLAAVTLFGTHAPEGMSSSAQASLLAVAFGLGTLVAMGIAAVVLSVADTATLFRGMAGLSVVATLGAVLLARRIRAAPG
jgi:MFS transporter, PPP family, 3-phenylpropionic acid transporter